MSKPLQPEQVSGLDAILNIVALMRQNMDHKTRSISMVQIRGGLPDLIA
jgi:hypothetical protein